MKNIFLTLLMLCSCFAINAQQIYSADFFTIVGNAGFPDHTTNNPPMMATPEQAVGYFTGPLPRSAWTAVYFTTPATDATPNEFSVKGTGKLRIQDWGGTARWASDTIDVSNVTLVNITAIGETLGADVQNDNGEFFEYFYILDGGSEIKTPISLSGDTAGTAVNYDINNLDVSGVDVLEVGFRFNVEDEGDGYEISTFEVTTGPTLQFTASNYTVNEGDNVIEALVCVSIDNENSNPTSVDISFSETNLGGNINATNGGDIATFNTQTLTFPANSNSEQCITFTVIDDNTFEPDEVFNFFLSNSTNNAIMAGAFTGVTILNNDPTPPPVFNEPLVSCGLDETCEFNIITPILNTNLKEWRCVLKPNGIGYRIFGNCLSCPFPESERTESWLITDARSLAFTNEYLLELDIEKISGEDFSNPRLVVLYSTNYVTGTSPKDPIYTWTEVQNLSDDTATDFQVNLNALPNEVVHIAIRYKSSGGDTGQYINWDISNIEFFADICPTIDPIVEFATPTYNVNEEDGTLNATVCASITNENASPTSVDVAFAGGTATNGTDISTYNTQTLTFPANSNAQQCISFTLTDDADLEANETLKFALENATNNATITRNDTTTVVIKDNDSPVLITEIGDANDDNRIQFVEICNRGSVTVDISRWTLKGDTDGDLNSDFEAFVAGTVLLAAGECYIFRANTFPAADVSACVGSVTSDDINFNGSQSFWLTDGTFDKDFYNGQTLNFGGGRAVRRGNIVRPTTTFSSSEWAVNGATAADMTPCLDDGFLPELRFTSSTYNVNEGDGTLSSTVCISITNAKATATSVDVVLTGGTATNGTDISTYNTQTLTFPPNSTMEQCISFTLTDDSDIEVEETLEFSLQNATNDAKIESPSTTTVTITDNEMLTSCETDTDCSLFNIVPVQQNTDGDNWECSNSTYTVNGDCGFFCFFPSDLWLISDAIDLTNAMTYLLELDALGGSGVESLNIQYSTNYLGSGSPASATWTSVGMLNFGGSGIDLRYDLSAAAGNANVYIAIQYTSSTGDGPLGYQVSNVELLADLCPGTVPALSVEFTASTFEVNEGDGTVSTTICASITNPNAMPTSIEVALTGGTATNGTDITTYTTATLTFPANMSDDQCITITLIDDSDVEGDETLEFTLQNPSNSATIGTNGTTTVTITDNDTNDPCPDMRMVNDDPIAADTYRAANTLTSTGRIAADSVVTFEAGQSITLSPNFIAENGSTFTARIQTCASAQDQETLESRNTVSTTTHEIRVYPNPLRDNTTIELELATANDMTIRLYDLTGRLVKEVIPHSSYEAGTHQFQLDAASLEKGIYILMFQIGTTLGTKKISIIH